MDSVQPPVITGPVNRGVFGTKLPSSIALITGVLLFFLPFVDIKCNDLSIQKISGFEIARGAYIDPAGPNNPLMESTGNTLPLKTPKGERKDPNIYALAALALGLLALVFSLINSRPGMVGTMLTGTLAVAAMIALVVDVKRSIRAESLGTEDGITVSVGFTPWFYLSLLSFVAGVLFTYTRLRPVNKE